MCIITGSRFILQKATIYNTSYYSSQPVFIVRLIVHPMVMEKEWNVEDYT